MYLNLYTTYVEFVISFWFIDKDVAFAIRVSCVSGNEIFVFLHFNPFEASF